ncbi:MAG TPA: TRAP transporter small permease [Rhizobiales bacterium]|nr:TRAP transporter small permease [Hyphomicrobiales bacterium]
MVLRAIEALARGLAILGGLVLVVITAVVAVSIIGRGFIWAGLGPVPGDYEIVEAGTGFAVFAFLPWCQLRRGHATVDLFTSVLPEAANRFIDLVSELLMTIVIALIAWRLWAGMIDKMNYNETTFILQFPIWWAYAACMAAAAVAVVVSVVVLGVRIAEVARGRAILLPGQGSAH